MEHLAPIIGWLAPILSTLIVTALTAQINARSKIADEKRDEARAEAAMQREKQAEWQRSVDEKLQAHEDFIAERDDWFEWRRRIERDFAEQNSRTAVILELQCSQIRSDLIHRSHRYIDDLGCASTEEKDAFWAQYEDYQRICEANGIENHFIDRLAAQVMALPTREI